MAYISFQPSDYFNTKLYVGNGSDAHSITGVGFKPDLVWTKNRTSATDNYLHDIVRGVQNAIRSNVSSGTYATSINLQSFDSDGFTVGTQDGLNQSSNNIVSWNWLAGGSQGSANTDGSINTTYTSANTTSGFSISTYTGTGSVGTIGHGLGAVPKMIIVKRLDSSSSWSVYHSALGNANQFYLNTNGASVSSSGWNSTDPTSSVFSIGSTASYNGSGNTYVAYCFAEKTGFSKFGSYSSNNNTDGNFIYTGFLPAFVYIKQTNASGESSKMYDNKRLGYNVVANWLEADDNQAEGTGSNQIDILSNGFKLRATNTAINASGGTYIYMAFAEEPLVSSNGVPAVAR